MGLRCLFKLAVSTALLITSTQAQTSSSCNPLVGTCPPNPALGKSLAVDFAKGAPDTFTFRGNPTFDSNGVSFTISRQGDSPQMMSNFYMMFGKLEVSVKAASGAGIVSSVVLQSDDLDEIDWEWLGADAGSVQTNYFGKGQTTTYGRGAFHPNPGCQSSFKKYTIDWTADQIVWQIDGSTVRALRPQDASGQYPQTPMQIKIGSWSGGDPSNQPGTIEWARGPTDYSKAPFTMQVKSLVATDYSTGTQYKYNGNYGTWESIQAEGGHVNPSGPGSNIVVSNPPAVTSASPGMPMPYEGTHRDTSTPHSTPGLNGWSMTPTTLIASSNGAATAYPGLPSGWTVTNSGKVHPPSSAPSTDLPPSWSASWSGSSVSVQVANGPELTTSWDDRGFPTVVAVVPGASSGSRAYNEQGFLVTSTPTATGQAAQGSPGFMALKATSRALAASLPQGPGTISGILMGFIGGILLL